MYYELELAECDGARVRRARSEFALRERRSPFDAFDPGQMKHVLQRVGEKGLGPHLLLCEMRESLHPALERQAHAHEIAREEKAYARKSAVRIPEPGQAEQDHGDSEQCLRECDHVDAMTDFAYHEAAEHERQNEQKQEQAVEEIDADRL